MATPSGTARTQLALWGGMTRRYGSFAGKAGPPAGTTVLAGCAVLSLTPQAPTFAFGGITVEASCAVLDLTPQAPAIEREPFIVLAGCAQLDLTPQAPAFDQDSVYTAGCAELVLTPNAPSIIVTTQVVAAGCAELILTPQAPTIIASGDVRVLAGCAELVLTPQSPSNSLGESSSFVPSPAVTFFDATSGPEPLPMTPGLALLVPDLEPLAAGPPPFAPDFVRRAQLRSELVERRARSGQRVRSTVGEAMRPTFTVKWTGLTLDRELAHRAWVRDELEGGTYAWPLAIDGPGLAMRNVRFVGTVRYDQVGAGGINRSIHNVAEATVEEVF